MRSTLAPGPGLREKGLSLVTSFLSFGVHLGLISRPPTPLLYKRGWHSLALCEGRPRSDFLQIHSRD